MVQLIEQYGVGTLIGIVVTLALATKSLIDFIGWAKEKLKGSIKKEEQYTELREHIDVIANTQKEIIDKVNNIMSTIKVLTDSDRDDIKAFITREHHYFCYQQKWIDDYSLDCIEKRYKHYVDEGGNSFVADLMHDIRELPHNGSNQGGEHR